MCKQLKKELLLHINTHLFPVVTEKSASHRHLCIICFQRILSASRAKHPNGTSIIPSYTIISPSMHMQRLFTIVCLVLAMFCEASYVQTCRKCSLRNGSKLTCECEPANKLSSWTRSVLNLDHCVANSGGRLERRKEYVLSMPLVEIIPSLISDSQRWLLSLLHQDEA